VDQKYVENYSPLICYCSNCKLKVEYIWKKHWTVVKLLYILVRETEVIFIPYSMLMHDCRIAILDCLSASVMSQVSVRI